MDQSIRETVYGHIQLRSPWFSNRWRVLSDDGTMACSLQRLGRIYTTIVTHPEGNWIPDPHGAGVVRALDSEGREFAWVVRRSWTGCRWDLVSPHWSYELVSNPRSRSWAIQIGGTSAAEIRSSLVSYNRVNVNAVIGVPLAAVLLGWHLIARPWEAIAESGGLLSVGLTESEESGSASTALRPISAHRPKGPDPFSRH